MNKYLWAPRDGDDDNAKRDGEKRTALWFGPRLGKRLENFRRHMEKINQTFSHRNQAVVSDNLPNEIYEILEKVQKSPELQNILAEKLQLDSSPYVIYIPNCKFHV